MRKRSREEWARLFAQQEESGLTQRVFCERVGLSYHGFRTAKGRYLKEERRIRHFVENTGGGGIAPARVGTDGFLEVEVLPNQSQQQALSAAAGMTPETAEANSTNQQELEVQLPFGVVLRFRGMDS